MRAGLVVLNVESRGARIRTRPDATHDEVVEAAAALAEWHARRSAATRRRDLVVDTIDGERAAGSRWAEAFVEAGFRSIGARLRHFGTVVGGQKKESLIYAGRV